MAKGRPSKYLTVVKPRFDEIEQWVRMGCTDKEIAKALGVGITVFCGYKKDYPELKELISRTRQNNIDALKAALYKKAVGFTYEETETVYDGVNTKTITRTRVSLPSESAALILLKHWDRNDDGSAKWYNDPATYKLKEKEYLLKKETFEQESW